MARDSGYDPSIDPDTGMPYANYSAPVLTYSPKSQTGFTSTPAQDAAFRAAAPAGTTYTGIDAETGIPVYHDPSKEGGFLKNIGDALQPLAPLLAAAGIDFLSGGAASGALASIFGGGAADAAAAAASDAALGTAGTTSAMAGGFGDTAAALSSPVIPAAATLTGDLAPLASAAPVIAPEVPAFTPLSEVGVPPVVPEAPPVGTQLSDIGVTPPAVAPAGVTPISQLPAFDQYVPPEAVSPAVTSPVTPPVAQPVPPVSQLPAFDQYVPPEAVNPYVAPPVATFTPPVTTDVAPGLTSAPAAAGLTAPVATDAASAGAGLTSGEGTTGLTAAVNPSLAADAPLAAAAPVAAGMGGGTGLTALSNIGAAAGAPLAAAGLSDVAGMGAPGLTTPTLNGGTVGETGVTAPITSGVNTVADTTTGTSVPSSLLQQLQTATGLSGTQLASLLQGGIGAVNSSNISNAIGAGVNAQAAANAQSQGVLKDVYNTNLGFQQPYQAAGTGAVNQLAAQQPYLTHQFDATDLQKGLAPNYDFMLQQGQMANQRAANVGGGALSGNTLQGLQNYTQNYAGNAYQNAFNNYQNQRNNIYNSLSGIANIGQTANTGATTAGQNYGTGTVGLNTGLAGVQAAGLLGQAQAGASGASGLGNSVLLSSLLGQNPSAATTTPASQLGNVAGVVNTGTNLYNQFSKLFGG